MNTVIINNKEYEVKFSLRTTLYFEQITKKTFELKNTTDILVYYYCSLLAASSDMGLSFDDFIDNVDGDTLSQFNDILMGSREGIKPSDDEVKKK